jgi:inorganic pyrophosphatase
VEDVRPSLRAEIEHFFAVYKQLEGKPTRTEGYAARDVALRVIEEARRRAGNLQSG